MIKGMDEVKEVVSQLKACFEKRNGMKSIFFVACGGSLAASYPARYMLEMESLSLRVYGINSGEFVTSLPASVNESALVIAISTKATPETVEALALARKAGAVTVGMTGEADSLTAENADYKLVYLHADEWYKDPRLIHCNSQGTALKLAFELLNEFEGYPNYDKAMAALEMFPQIYATAYNKVKSRAVAFGMRYKDDTIFNVLSSGAAWEVSYSDAFCFFQEMQTVHCVPCHSGEYFHGAFETTDSNLAIILFKSAGRTRPLDERAERFLEKFGGHHYVVDALELGIGSIETEVIDYFNALLMHPISKQLISGMGEIRMHPMSYRRYMWKFAY